MGLMFPIMEGKSSRRSSFPSATVGSAWCTYQNDVWSSIASVSLAESAALGREVGRLRIEADEMNLVDLTMFMEYVSALSEKNEFLSGFYRARFRPPMKVAVEAWLQTNPLEAIDAPLHPFAMREYALVEREEAAALTHQSIEKLEDARKAIHDSDRYVMLTVLFASVLFFAGIGPHFESRGVRSFVLGMGAAIGLLALGLLSTYPVASL